MVTTTKILIKIVLFTSLFIKSFEAISTISSSEESQEDFHDTDMESSLSILYRDNLDKLKIPFPAPSRIEEHTTEEPYVMFPPSQDYNMQLSDIIEKLNMTTEKKFTRKFEHIEIKSLTPENKTEENLISQLLKQITPENTAQENSKLHTTNDNLPLSENSTENDQTLNKTEKNLTVPDSDIKVLNHAGSKIIEQSSDDSIEQLQDRTLPRETVNWTSCEEFLNGSTLDVNRTLGNDWKMFAGWVFLEHANWTDRQLNYINNSFTIRLPPKEDIQKSENVELVMEDEFMSGFMWRQNNISGLYQYRPLPVNTTFQIADAHNLSIALRLSELGHLGFKDCHTRVLLLAARRDSFPTTDTEALQAASLFNMTTDPNFVQYHEGPVLVWKLIRAIKLVF